MSELRGMQPRPAVASTAARRPARDARATRWLVMKLLPFPGRGILPRASVTWRTRAGRGLFSRAPLRDRCARGTTVATEGRAAFRAVRARTKGAETEARGDDS